MDWSYDVPTTLTPDEIRPAMDALQRRRRELEAELARIKEAIEALYTIPVSNPALRAKGVDV